MLDKKQLSLLPPNNQSTPLVTAISPKSSSNLDTDQGEAVDETHRKVVQTFNQTLLMTTGCTLNSNIGSNNDPHDNIVDRQPASTLNKMTIKENYHPHKDQIGIDQIINFKRTKEVITCIEALSNTPELHNKILHELDCNGLMYIFE